MIRQLTSRRSILSYSLMRAFCIPYIMEPLPLIPRIQNKVSPAIVCLVREVFQNAFQTETATWRISTNLSKSCRQYPDLREIAAQIQAEIIEHERTLEDLQYAEIQIMRSHGYHLCKDQIIRGSERAKEIIRLKRHPLYIDLQPNIVEKYPLLQSDDLLPPMHECATDFRLDKRDRIKMKKRLCKSRDSFLEGITLPKIISRVCRFGTLNEQRSRKVRHKERSASHKRSIIKSEYPKTVLIAEPEELFFHNFEYNKIYKKTVLIKNVSNSMARYKIERRSPDSKFTILFDNAAVGTNKIAPGMHLKLTVLFICNVIEDPKEFLIINVQSGKTVCVKMYGYRDAPILRALSPAYRVHSVPVAVEMEKSSWSLLSITEEEGEREIHEEQQTGVSGDIKEYGKSEPYVKCNANLGANFECGPCFVGERIVVPIRFVNDGGDGKFFIMSEIDWCTMNIDDIMDCNMMLIPPFAIWPTYFALRSGECAEIRTYFYPESYGMQVDKLYILCDNYTIHPVELMGDGILFEPDIVRFGDNIEKIRSVDGNKPFDNYHLNMGDAGSDETIKCPVLVTNTSGLAMYYRWEKSSANASTSSSDNRRADLPIVNLDIQPVTGVLNSNSITPVKVIARTTDLQFGEYRAILRLYIDDIPLAAISKDCHLTVMECSMKRRNCPITVAILVAEIEVWVNCTIEKIYLEPGINEKTEQEISCSDEAGNTSSANDNYLSSTSTATVHSLPKESSMMTVDPSICDIENVQCNEYHKDRENSGRLWSAPVAITQKVDTDASALPVPTLDFRCQTTNTAILIPGRTLYMGLAHSCKITLRNLFCKPLSYAWGEPSGNDRFRMKVNFNPEKGLIPPTNTTTIEVICLPMETGTVDHFFVPCFIGGREDPIILGIECTIGTLYVTFLFLPASDVVSSPCSDSVRIEWHKDGHTSALNLNNLEMNENTKIEEERELKNIHLDTGNVFATAAVGSIYQEIENASSVYLPETPSISKQKLNKLAQNTAQNNGTEKLKIKNSPSTTQSKLEKTESPLVRSWENLLEGIIWSTDRPDEFIQLTKAKTTVPFYKTIVPPITQALAIEFVNLPLRTVKKRTFVIRNETPAESEFLITLKNFGPTEMFKELTPKNTIDVAYASIIGRKLENYWDEIKPPGQGIVLVIEPTKGVLAPYETIPIDIYVYADTWGVYVDDVTVAILGLPDYVFGVCTQVVGSPIAYPICKNGLHELPTLRFGTLSFGTESIKRKIMIENTSTVMLVINWYSYLDDPCLVTKNSVPFNIILQILSPFTNKIANTTCPGLTDTHGIQKLSTADTTMEESEQNALDFDHCDSMPSSSIIDMNFSPSDRCKSETKTESQVSTFDLTWHTCCSESLTASQRNFDRTRENNTRNSFRGDHPEEEYAEYTTGSETGSVRSSEGTIDKETDLKLDLTPYYGEPDYSMFTVSPAEIIIPAKGKTSIEITLNLTQNNLRTEDCRNEILGRLIGFLRVAPIHKYKADCYSRNDGTMLTPTEIQLEAIIIQPKLSYEISMSDRTFKIYASSGMREFGKQIKISRKYVFYNNEEETMLINGESNEPFQVLSLSTQKAKINPLQSDGISVPPGKSVEVEVLCVVDANWIDKAMEMARYEDLYLDTKKSLLISHVGSCTQVVPLCLRVYLPLLKLSTHRMNFGTVCLRDSKQLDLSIENISSEKQILNIRVLKSNKDFTVSQSRGILLLPDKIFSVMVTFTPSWLGESAETLEISTIVSGYVEECLLEGYGSWDDKFHDTTE